MRRLEGPRGETGMAIKFRNDLAAHPILVDGLTELTRFMRNPGHRAVAPLLHWDRRQALFIYDIGNKVLLADIIDRSQWRDQIPGERVAMELLVSASVVLDGAAREATRVGITNHGSLDPWHVLVDRDGSLSLLAYGLPPMDAIAWLDENGPLPERGIGYWPPERIDDSRPEGVFSDIYAMAVMATELAIGHPILDESQPGNAIKTILGMGGLRAQVQELGGLTRDVRQLLMELLHEEEDLRPPTAGEMGMRARQLMNQLSGKTLAELAQSAVGAEAPSPSTLHSGQTLVPGRPLAERDDFDLLEDDPLTQGYVDDQKDDDDPPTSTLDPLWAAPESPTSQRDPLWDDGPASAEDTWEMAAVDDDLAEPTVELPTMKVWDEDVEDDNTIHTAVPHHDDLSEEVPRAIPEAQYETSGVFNSLGPADSDFPPRPPTDEQLRDELTDPQGWSQRRWDDTDDALLDAPEPSMVDPIDLGDDEGPTFEHDPEGLNHVVKGFTTDQPTYFSEDIEKAEADARRARDAEIEAAVAAREEEEARAERLLSELPPIDEPSFGREATVDQYAADEDWGADEPGTGPVTMSIFEPMGPAPEVWSGQFETPYTEEEELDDVDVDPVDPPISLTAAREAWPDAPHQILLTASKVDLDAQRVLHDHGGLVSLSEHQTALLAYLAARPGREITSDELFHGAMRGREGSAKSVPGIIARLRNKTERDPKEPDHLLDGEAGGYLFVAGESSSPGPSPLPEPAGPLHGRDRELFDVIGALHEDALVTVVGPPGAGASQVALRAAIAMAEEGFEVHRAPVGGGESVASVLARGLGIRRLTREDHEVLNDIGRRLSEQEDLVLFLDAPQERPGLRDIVQRWMHQRPRGVILVAARGALELPGERVFRLGSLSIEEAIELFRKRVSHYRPGSQVPDELAAAVAEHLDRMPLALEAAAARTAFVSPDVLRRRLDQGLELEWGEGGLDADLAATLERVDALEMKALEQLVVFRDGFELSAAESVVRLPDATRSLITVLDSLAAKSLLHVTSPGNTVQVRWMLYETVRAHVRRGMDAQELEEAQRRHAETFGQLGLKLGAGPWVERPARESLVREQENLRAALQYSIPESGGAALGLTSILGYEDAGRLREAVDRWLGDHKRTPPSRSDLDLLNPKPTQEAFDWTNRESLTWQAAARLASARLDLHLGQPQKARSSLREAAELATHEVKLLAEVAWLHAELGSTFESEAALNKVSSADEWVRGVIALMRGRIHAAKTNMRKAERAFHEARHAFGELDADIGKAHVQRHLAEVYVDRGRGRRAISLVREALETFEDVLDIPSGLRCRMRIAELLVGLGEREDALADLDEITSTAKQFSANGLLALARGILGVVRTMDRDFEEGERLFFLALAGSAPDQKRIQALFSLALLLQGDRDSAHEEARGALPNSVAQAVVAVLERTGAPHENETAFLLYEAIESWRSGAALARFDAELADRPSIAVRMVLQCPQPKLRNLAGK
ncbi:MAG: winged helix-turn-helix domain-containing protein [Myxococcota bacterium]